MACTCTTCTSQQSAAHTHKTASTLANNRLSILVKQPFVCLAGSGQESRCKTCGFTAAKSTAATAAEEAAVDRFQRRAPPRLTGRPRRRAPSRLHDQPHGADERMDGRSELERGVSDNHRVCRTNKK